jgi:hypothetical protein
MTINDIPPDSILRSWLTYLNSTEVPFAYQVVGGLSAIGASLRRNRWVDQFEWRVYPNQSVMFIGPSGVGKDTVINRIQRTLDKVTWLSHVPTLGGVTLEYIHARLAELPAPAAAIIPAPEMTAFFGKADYQQNMLTGVTNLLSNGEKIDITTKGAYTGYGQPGAQRQEKVIWQPTVTMLAGSTVEWLHKAMPDGTLEGGFLGRFLIVVEEVGSRHIPLVKSNMNKQELESLRTHIGKWDEGVEECIRACAKPREVILYREAEALYANWYHNRFKLFSATVKPYANRSRDTVLRLAMLMAFSRGHYRWIEEEDVAFAISLMRGVADKIDAVCLPPTPEAQVARKIMEQLPATRGQLIHSLAERYRMPIVIAALDMLNQGLKLRNIDGVLHAVEKEGE